MTSTFTLKHHVPATLFSPDLHVTAQSRNSEQPRITHIAPIFRHAYIWLDDCSGRVP